MSRCDQQSNMTDQSNTMLPPAVQSTIHNTFPDLTSAIIGASTWTTDDKKTMPNLRSMQNTPCVHEFTKNIIKITFSCLNLVYFFARTFISFEHITLWVLYRPSIKAIGEISDVFEYFSCRLEPYHPRFVRSDMCLVLK